MTAIPSFPHIDIEVSEGIGVVAMNRPPVNAMTASLYVDLRNAFEAVANLTEVRVLVLRSAIDRVFTAGADIKELGQRLEKADPGYDDARQLAARTLVTTLLDLPIPTIACVNGPALGTGVALAACCDIRYASERATFGLPEINVGRCGGGRHSMRMFPQGTVRQMYFTGRPVDAKEAYRLGAVQKVVAHGEELGATMELAREIAGKSPLALRMAKEALNTCEWMPITEGYQAEQQFTIRLGKSNDAKEAARAFTEKRAPVWTGT
jgi:enoyl-CoA hydratase/carnithine racemase